MDADRFDDVARSLARNSTRRHLFGIAAASGVSAMWPIAGAARRHGKRKCGPCEKRKRGKCKPGPDGIVCGEGKICRKSKCDCQQPCGAGRTCLANGSCARVCPASFDCGPGCGCSLPNIDGPQFCANNEGGCMEFTQGCEGNADCPIGLHCVPSFCATPPVNRCFPLCPLT